MKCVLVIEKDGNIRQRVPYDEENGAVIYLYDKESRIVWESVEGRHYTDSIPYETRRLFYEPRFLDMCRKYAASTGFWNQEKVKEEPDFENVMVKGIDAFDEKEVFIMCSKRIREDNYEEDEVLNYLCFELFQRQQYDRVTLTYLANYYCGATKDMKKIWKVLQEYGIPSYKLGERIITQMVFSETLFDEEDIFEDYYLSDNAYFRLKQAYLAYVSREYMVEGRELKHCVFEMIANECDQREELPDICKAALLKHYSERKHSEEMEVVLHQVLREMCEKQMVFPFYLKYREEWLRELQLYNKAMLSYQCHPGGKVKLYYKMKQGDREELGYRAEAMMPMYANIYVKQFILFDDESVSYYFEENIDGDVIKTEKQILVNDSSRNRSGKYGRLNEMSQMGPAAKRKAMMDYQEEELMADQLFVLY